MQRLRRQLPFLRSGLQEANRFKRQEQHANADQINAVSELVLNLLKNKIPVTPPIMAKLRPYKKVLRDLGRRQHSVKKRRAWLVQQKGRGLFQGLHHVLCQCVRLRFPRGCVCYKTPIGTQTSGKKSVLIGSINITCCIESTGIS